jgi:ribosomal protein S18 acetylase RimI-like enzyme
MKKLNIVKANLSNLSHAEAILQITNAYANDTMGMNRPLHDEVKRDLIDGMKTFPGTCCFIAYVDDQPAGVANCFYGFSTFNAARLLNVHDLAVNPAFRSKGIGEALLSAVEKEAAEKGCCKVTLEVREDNRARNLYERVGFEYGEPRMFYMSKSIS